MTVMPRRNGLPARPARNAPGGHPEWRRTRAALREVLRHEAHRPRDDRYAGRSHRTRTHGATRPRAPGRTRGKDGAAFLALFEHANFDVQQTEDFTTAVWRKLCLNCAGAVSAVLLKPAGIAQHDGVAEIMRTLVRECAAVGRAEGATLTDSIPDDIVAGARRAPREAGNSMLADRRAGRPMEIDARNGVIVRLGSRHGIPAPMNALMVSLLEAAQNF